MKSKSLILKKQKDEVLMPRLSLLKGGDRLDLEFFVQAREVVAQALL